MGNKAEIVRDLENWRDEVESALLYRALTQAEFQPALAEVYCRLVIKEQTHAQFWEDKLRRVDYPLPKRRIGWQARALALQMIADRTVAVATLAREELGLAPEKLGGSAEAAAATSFLLFAAKAIAPVAPFVFLPSPAAIYASLFFSGIVLFLIGAGITLLAGRSVLYPGWRQVLVGFAAAGMTYIVGHWRGVAISG